MKSFLLSLLLILCFGFSTKVFDQLDQASRYVVDLQTHFEIGVVSVGQEIVPKIKQVSHALISLQATDSLNPAFHQFSFYSQSLSFSNHSNFISSGASLVHHLARIRA